MLTPLRSLWLILLFLVWHPAAAQAHGGGVPHLYKVPAGPYQLTVWLSPEPPRAGALQIAIEVEETVADAVEEAASKPPLVDAAAATVNVQLDAKLDAKLDVQVVAHPLGQPGVEVRQTAVKERTFFLDYYKSNLVIPAAGKWAVDITVAGAGASEAVRFLIDVGPARGAPWDLIFWGACTLFALSWAVWVMRT